MKRQWIKLSVSSLLADIAWKEANGFDFEAKTLKSLFKMTPSEEAEYKMFLESNIASKKRRENNYL